MRKIYKPFVIFMVLFYIQLFSPFACFSLEKEEGKRDLNQRRSNSLQKSLFVPGWGQLAEKKYFEGFLFFSAEVFCLYKVISNNNKGNDYYRLYKNAENVSNAIEYRKLTEKYDSRRNRFILAAAGIWIINLIDIYFIVKNKDKKERSLKIKLEQNENKDLALTVTFSF